ncbi:hypothetical protein [Kribbella sp. CA-294648]|uniref:hypothetical protein n=1 Tax=Kribbella sp. CA-294648 TaxID=3239948 RepID=UPI003D9473B1
MTAGPSEVNVVWPKGYTVRGDAKSFEILDGTQKVVARSGTSFTMGGGGVDRFLDTWTGRDCLNGTSLWMVGSVPAS